MASDHHPEFETQRGELVALLERSTGAPGTCETAVPGLRFHRREAPTEPAFCFYQPALALVAQGAKEVLLGGERFVYDEAHYLVTSVDLPVSSRVTEASPRRPYLSLSLELDLGDVGSLVDEVKAPPPPAPDARGLAANRVPSSLLEATLRLVRLLDTPEDLPVLAPLVRREILYRLLQGQAGARLRHMAVQDSPSRQIAQAIGWLKGHYAEPLRIRDLARAVAMSESSLHHHFRQVTAMSPLQFQKQLRLQEARRLMITGTDAAGAGHRVGYESPSHFSRDYRRIYGAPPRQDVDRLR